MSEKTKLMRQIQMLDFAVTEAALFLDTHPNNKKALAYYKKHRDMRDQVASAYEEMFGPLTIGGVSSQEKWTWVTACWPWETEE